MHEDAAAGLLRHVDLEVVFEEREDVLQLHRTDDAELRST